MSGPSRVRLDVYVCIYAPTDNSYRITRPSLGGITHSRSILGTLTGWTDGHACAHGVSDAEHVERPVVGTGHGVSGGHQSASHRVHAAEPAVDPAGQVHGKKSLLPERFTYTFF